MENKVIMTQTEFDAMKERLNYLKNEVRPIVVEKIKEARAQGDLSENAEYDAAREEQGHVESEIAELEYKTTHANVVEESADKSVVAMGHSLLVFDEDFEEEMEIAIVGTSGADPLNNKFSIESPMGKAFLGAHVGDRVGVTGPDGDTFYYKVLEIR